MGTVKRRVLLSPDATRQFCQVRAADRTLVRDAMKTSLEVGDATEETRNRFRLRRPSPFADYELRVEDYRIFYRVVANEVLVAMIGRKRGNFLVVDRRRFIL